ncbi:MAG TPA: EAL domain-containing protein [Methylophilaceae bacterium]|nr:EAL domain-containing protein [Methylophilaceae bacterium]
MNQMLDWPESVNAEQVRQLYAGVPTSLITSSLLAILLAYVQSGAVDGMNAFIWLILIELSFLARALLYRSWLLAPEKKDSSLWLRRFRIGTISSGVLWGLSAFLLFPAHDVTYQATLAFALAGVTAGAMVSYCMDLVSVIGYTAPLMLPLIVQLFTESSDAGLLMSGMTLLFLFFIVASAKRQHRHLIENVALRLQADAGKAQLLQKDADLKLLTERLTAVIEAIPDAIFFKDGKGRWLITNKPAKRLYKLHGFRWRGKTGTELAKVRPELRTAHEASLVDDEYAWQAGKLTICQQLLVGTDATPHHYEIRKMPLFGSDGRRKALVVIARDVTELHAAERELRIAAAAFDVQEGIMITDAGNRILRVNRAFVTLTGYSAEEAVGNTPSLLRSGRQSEEFYQSMWETLNRSRYWQGELWNRRKNGELFPVWLTTTALIDTDGKVRNYIAAFSDITQYKKAEEEIHNLAFYDYLTGLPNRRLLLDRVQQALVTSARHDQHGAILFIDLDNFKTLNDTRGHAVGDLLLIEVAKRLSECVRAEDTVSRLGGDEFVVMLEGLSEVAWQAGGQAELVGEKILDVLNQPYLLGEYEHHSTPSIGISLFRGSTESVEEILKHADTAMYQAKQSGRNTMRFFDPAMQKALESHILIEADLRQALPQQQLILYYQTQVDDARRVIGAELLIRWNHPVHGMISPLEFIPVAEESRLIISIGTWVLQTACAQLKQWEQHPQASQLQLAVNVSARQFRQADFVAQVSAALQQHSANPALLKLELTESLVLDNVSDTVEKMQALKALGVGFAMDDFGTGHSSLAQLKRLPLDQVKIDQSFVRDIATDPNDATIVQTIIAMTGALGLDVIAEGVETEAQLQFLRENGCRKFQGYLFGQPVPVAEFEQLLITLH